MMFRKVLIANRGEIAIRIIRACRELGIKSVAVYSEADRESLHVKYADECYLVGRASPSQSYLNIERIIEVAEASGSEAIHPGYGFLAQIPAFAEACEAHHIEFIGPSSAALKRMGDKAMARKTMMNAGVSIIPGSTAPVRDENEVVKVAEEIGYPVLVKAVYGGGGRGMRVIEKERDVPKTVELARLEAETSFGNSKIYVEKLLKRPRHIEFQTLRDKRGNIIHLSERDCTIQRRYQKLLEEAPSPIMNQELRETMGKVAIHAVEAADSISANTVEFLVAEDRRFYFLEMNTRLQVEHLITEMVTGIDMVKEQIKIAAGEELPFRQDEIILRGHAINCRINSEDPHKDFEPCPGTVTRYRPPGGPGVRVDSALYAGYTIPIFYDSLIAKLSVWGANREEAIRRMRNALDEYVIEGIRTTIPLHKRILEDRQFQKGEVSTSFIQDGIGTLREEETHKEERVAALYAALALHLTNRRGGLAVIPRRRGEGVSAWKTMRGRVIHRW